MKGCVLYKGQKIYSYMDVVFKAIKEKQHNYNWWITSYECVTNTNEAKQIFSGESVWITGEELNKILEADNVYWTWGVFSGFDKSVQREEVILHEVPYADGYEGFWKKEISIQHSLADVEIVQWDSSLILIISKDEQLIDDFMEAFPLAEDLEEYNKQ